MDGLERGGRGNPLRMMATGVDVLLVDSERIRLSTSEGIDKQLAWTSGRGACLSL